MGIIMALKKRYNYLYLKDFLEFYDLSDEVKTRNKQQAQHLRAGTAVVDYGNPAHLLNAANYMKVAWDAIVPNTINFFLSRLKSCSLKGLMVRKIRAMNWRWKGLENLQIFFNLEELEHYFYIDNENNEEFIAAILKEVEIDLATTMRIKD
jgi:hypothetical protein